MREQIFRINFFRQFEKAKVYESLISIRLNWILPR